MKFNLLKIFGKRLSRTRLEDNTFEQNKIITNKPVHITTDLLNTLEQTNGIKEIVTQQDFFDVLKIEKAIVYLLVNWSGPELVSRYCVYQALNELVTGGTPAFKIDCSDQSKDYIVEWLDKQREGKKEFYYGGWGETLFLYKGVIVDYINNPAKLGLKKTKEKLSKWKNAAHMSDPFGTNVERL